jgi:hypothetical protein
VKSWRRTGGALEAHWRRVWRRVGGAFGGALDAHLEALWRRIWRRVGDAHECASVYNKCESVAFVVLEDDATSLHR